MAVDYPGAVPCLVDRDRVFIDQNTHYAIVLHKTASNTGGAPYSVEELGAYFNSNDRIVSSHYGIGLDGRVAQYVQECDGAAANCCLEPGYDKFWDSTPNRNKNLDTISIEHIDLTEDNSQAMSAAQVYASFKLIKYLVLKYGIPLSRIKGHNSLDPLDRSRCPGPSYPWSELGDYLNGGTTLENSGMYTAASADFRDYFTEVDTTHWQAKDNGYIVHGAIRSFYAGLTLDGHSLPIIGLPTSNEKTVNVPGKGRIIVQDYERGRLAYDPGNLEDSQPGCGDVYLLKSSALPGA